jgi:hypothetical protein
VAVRSLKLLGSNHCLRATGNVEFSGETDGLLFLEESSDPLVLYSLPEDSPPASWKGTAKGAFRAFRVTGGLKEPRCREIGRQDPAFKE